MANDNSIKRRGLERMMKVQEGVRDQFLGKKKSLEAKLEKSKEDLEERIKVITEKHAEALQGKIDKAKETSGNRDGDTQQDIRMYQSQADRYQKEVNSLKKELDTLDREGHNQEAPTKAPVEAATE